MTNKNKCYGGFTLLETLIVLIIVVSIAVLPVLAFKERHENIQRELFYSSFEKSMSRTQQAAIVSQKVSRINSTKEGFINFIYYVRSKQEIFTLELPKSIQLKFTPNVVYLSISGNNQAIQKVVFIDQKEKAEITYQLQMGSGKIVRKVNSL